MTAIARPSLFGQTCRYNDTPATVALPRDTLAARGSRRDQHQGHRRVANIAESDNLLPLVASGNPDAVRACLDRYSGLIWSLARRMCPTTADAEDAVQEVFVSVWKSADRFDPRQGSEATFIATIARRRLIDRTRRRKRRPDTSAADESQFQFADTRSASPAGEAISIAEESAVAAQAIRELSPDQQRVLRMSVLHGLSHEKIAQATDLPLGTVKTHIRRGLIKVRRMLAERNGTPTENSDAAVQTPRLTIDLADPPDRTPAPRRQGASE